MFEKKLNFNRPLRLENIQVQHLAILLRDFVKELAKRTQHLATSQYAATKM